MLELEEKWTSLFSWVILTNKIHLPKDRFYPRKNPCKYWKSAKLYYRLVLVSSGWPISKSERLLSPCLEEPQPELVIYRKLLGVAGGPWITHCPITSTVTCKTCGGLKVCMGQHSSRQMWAGWIHTAASTWLTWFLSLSGLCVGLAATCWKKKSGTRRDASQACLVQSVPWLITLNR